MKVPPTLRWGTESPECLLRADTHSDFLASHWRRKTGKTRHWAQAGVCVCVCVCVCLESLDVMVFVLGNPNPSSWKGGWGWGG